jgi:hypothetical protein
MTKFINYHLGLGDALICAGLVTYLSKNEDIIIPCYEHNFVSVKAIHAGNPRVQVAIFKDANEANEFATKRSSLTLTGENFPKGFYEQAGVDWKERWDSCPVWNASGAESIYINRDIIFIHDDAERGFNIDVGGIRIKNVGSPILTYIPFLVGCIEIHCIDSSFLHLTECIPTEKFLNSPKFFYHKSARLNSTDYAGCLKHNWEIV